MRLGIPEAPEVFVAVVIASTRAVAGVDEDRCGPIIVEWLNGRGIATPA
jgi:molybdenum cofactor biosynthesis protein B